jgi:hypothetical protein
MDKLNEQYLKGFNYAYLLAEHNPKLIEEIIKTTNSNDYILGLNDGKSTFEKKRVKSRTQEINKLLSKKQRSKDIDFER